MAEKGLRVLAGLSTLPIIVLGLVLVLLRPCHEPVHLCCTPAPLLYPTLWLPPVCSSRLARA